MKATISTLATLSVCAGASADIKMSAMPGGGHGHVVAGGDVLWDQSNFNADINALVDQQFPDFPDFSAYLVNDISVGGDGWNITGMTTYFTSGNGAWPMNANGALNIFDKTGGLPGGGDDPTMAMSVPVTISDAGGFLEVTASGLDFDLAPGEYWIGLTPDVEFASGGQEFHLAAPIVGDDAAFRNPGGAFGVGTEWQDVNAIDTSGEWIGNYDAAMLINGTIIPAPGAMALLGAGGLLVARRRR